MSGKSEAVKFYFNRFQWRYNATSEMNPPEFLLEDCIVRLNKTHLTYRSVWEWCSVEASVQSLAIFYVCDIKTRELMCIRSVTSFASRWGWSQILFTMMVGSIENTLKAQRYTMRQRWIVIHIPSYRRLYPLRWPQRGKIKGRVALFRYVHCSIG